MPWLECWNGGLQAFQQGWADKYIRKRFDYTALTVGGDVVENLWVRIKGMESKGSDVVGVCY